MPLTYTHGREIQDGCLISMLRTDSAEEAEVFRERDGLRRTLGLHGNFDSVLKLKETDAYHGLARTPSDWKRPST